MSWSNNESDIGPTSSRSRRCWRIISWPAANGISASSAVPIATVAPSGTNCSTACAIDMTFVMSLLRDGFHVRAVVAFQLGHRVAPELFEERFGERQRDDCFSDHACRRHDAHVAALVVGLGLFFGLEVDRLHRLFHGRDRLDRDAEVDRLAVRHAAGDASRAIRQVTKATLLVVDLVVEVGATPRRALEPRAELHAFAAIDGHHRLGQLAVELAVPMHVAAESWRNPTRDDAKRAAERVALLRHLVDGGNHAL